MAQPIAVTVSADVQAPLSHVFAVAVPVDLTKVMLKRGPLPGVRSIEGQTGPWNQAGQSRRIHLTDGSSVHEVMTEYVRNVSFSYRVTGFSGPFGALIDHAKGDWRFTEAGPATHIDWTYTFTPRSGLAAPILRLIVRALWPGYIGAALARIKALAEETRPA